MLYFSITCSDRLNSNNVHNQQSTTMKETTSRAIQVAKISSKAQTVGAIQVDTWGTRDHQTPHMLGDGVSFWRYHKWRLISNQRSPTVGRPKRRDAVPASSSQAPQELEKCRLCREKGPRNEWARLGHSGFCSERHKWQW